MAASVIEGGNYKNITATGSVTTLPGTLLGFFVNSSTAGTLVLRDGGAGGTVMGGTITPAAGAFYRFPATVGNLGLHATVGGTIDVTFFFALGAGV
jgi:hypothetical protein